MDWFPFVFILIDNEWIVSQNPAKIWIGIHLRFSNESLNLLQNRLSDKEISVLIAVDTFPEKELFWELITAEGVVEIDDVFAFHACINRNFVK